MQRGPACALLMISAHHLVHCIILQAADLFVTGDGWLGPAVQSGYGWRALVAIFLVRRMKICQPLFPLCAMQVHSGWGVELCAGHGGDARRARHHLALPVWAQS